MKKRIKNVLRGKKGITLIALVVTANNSLENKLRYLYITKDSKIYIQSEENRICLNNKYEELANEDNLRCFMSNEENNRFTCILASNKQC